MLVQYHQTSVAKIFSLLRTGPNGISEQEAKHRNSKDGLNVLFKNNTTPAFFIFARQFQNPLIVILMIICLATFYLGRQTDALIILFAILGNTIIGFVQEQRADKTLEKLKNFLEYKVIVKRNGLLMEISAEQITIGDIVILKSGSRIGADGRIIHANNLTINEAVLTGESLPVHKLCTVTKSNLSLPDRFNMAYAGTLVAQGSGEMLVTAIGQKTEMGKIAHDLTITFEEKTPLQKQLANFAYYLGFIITIIIIVVFIIGIVQGRSFYEVFMTSVTLGVSAIPEGLLIGVTVALTVGMRAILKRKALIRKLIAGETLGSVTIICSDKTGTLTQGKMKVVTIITDKGLTDITNSKHNKTELILLALKIGAICNDSIIEKQEYQINNSKIIGSPTESALAEAALAFGINKNKLEKSEPRIDELPFDSAKKYMITVHKKQKKYILYIKGAPEIVIEQSHWIHSNEGKKIVSTKNKKKFLEIARKMSNQGLRILAVAYFESEKNILLNPEKIQKLVFVGLIGLKDPLRPEARETIMECKAMGIKPIVITGDHRLTAKKIAEESGIHVKGQTILTGEDLDKLSNHEFKKLITKVSVYARISPNQKVKIIKTLKECGEVVAMTGDGVNDALALKTADVGIALGSGTDIAKEASDIVLLDDNFKSIVAAVREGRTIFSNIRKITTFLLSDTFSETILILGSMILGLPLALIPAQILWINLINDSLPHFALAFEKNDTNLSSNKPTLKTDSIINRQVKYILVSSVIIKDIFVLGIFYCLCVQFKNIEYARTLIFAILSINSLFFIFSVRSLEKNIWQFNPFSNKFIVVAVFVNFGLLIPAIYFDPLQKIMSTVALGTHDWIIVFSVGFLSLIFIETLKIVFKDHNRTSSFAGNHV